MNFKNQIPNKVKFIMDKIKNDLDCDSYIVGGAIRNLVLNKQPKDWDIATQATPEKISNIFEKTLLVGESFGTVIVVLDNEQFEITTFRKDGNYSDGRRPDNVEFTNNLKEDLSRRDFTINAMAMGLNGEIIDYFNGIRDLKNKTISSVGNPRERLCEDKLRALRAIRFSSQYNLLIDSNLSNEIKKISLENISKERIREEFNKILLSQNPRAGMYMLMSLNLLKFIIPELIECYKFEQYNIHHHKDVFEHTVIVLNNIEAKLELRLAALFHDIGKPNVFTLDDNNNGHFYEHQKESSKICREVMKRLKYSNREIDYVSELVYYHMLSYENLKPKSVKKFIDKVGIDKLDGLFKLQIADITGSKPPFDFKNIYKLKFQCEKILNEKQPLSTKDLKINGKDLIAELKLKPSKTIGYILNNLLDLVL